MDKALLDGLSHNEKRLLLALDERGGSATTADLVSGGAFSVEVEAMSAASWLESKGLAAISERSDRFYVLADGSAVSVGLPERVAITVIGDNGGSMPMADMEAAMPEGMGRIAVGWLKRKGSRKNKKIEFTVGLSMMCYTLGKLDRTCFGDFQLRGRIGKLL